MSERSRLGLDGHIRQVLEDLPVSADSHVTEVTLRHNGNDDPLRALLGTTISAHISHSCEILDSSRIA